MAMAMVNEVVVVSCELRTVAHYQSCEVVFPNQGTLGLARMTGSANLDMSQVRQLWQIGWRLLGGLLYARIKAVSSKRRARGALGIR